jgi:hypothetical protein
MAEQHNHEAHEKKLIIISFILVVITVAVFAFFLMPARGVGYAPTQPIPFSHELHAGVRKIPCAYCHSNVDKSPFSNIPSTAVCMNCHRVVKTESPHIKKIQESFEQNKPIQWIQVHVLPDFVYFNHQRHIQKGVSCDTCHGQVQSMAKVHQVAPLSMGWCINCHRKPENQAPTNCNTCHR